MTDSLLPDDQSERNNILNKWKDKPQDELLNAKVESDLYIKTLTARLDDLRNDYISLQDQHKASTELKELIDQMKSGVPNPNNTDTGNNQTAIKPEDIEQMIQQKLSAHQLAQKQKDNFDLVQSRLKESLGDNYESLYSQRLATLGLTREFADDLAKNHPTVFMKTFELDQKPITNNGTAPPRSTQRPSFTPAAPKRDWNYYQEMKKTNPRMYLDPKIAIQMHNDAIALGADFGMPED